MSLRYIIDAGPEQAAALTRVLAEIGIKFGAQENLCAMPQDNVQEGIFQGRDLEWLPKKANEYLADAGYGVRVREDIEVMDDLQAQYDFLMLMTLDSDWGGEPGGTILETSHDEIRKFQENHPLAVHDFRDEPAELPPDEPLLTDLRAPLFPRPKLGKILSTALVMLEDELAEGAGTKSPNDGSDPATGPGDALEAAPGLRYILHGIHEDYAPRDYMQEQFGDQIHVHAQALLRMLDGEDRDRLQDLVGKVVQERDRG